MKRLTGIILLIGLVVLSLCCCKPADGPSGGNNNSGGNNQNYEGLWIREGASFNVLVESGDKLDWDALERLAEITGIYPDISEGESEKKPNEILIGEVDREVSARGYELMRRLKVESTHHQPYLVYSDGKDIAFCYDGYILNDKYVIEYIFDLFTEKYLDGEEHKIKSGVLFSGTLDAVEYQQKKDDAMLDAMWENLAKEAGGGELGEETVKALQGFYEIYSDRAVEWLADLYDPDTGGFYYSNSGRNSAGFLPDLESTAQALTFLTGTGMTKSLTDILPKDMQEKLIAFAKSRQDPNGYFYHPQWEKSTIDSNLTRKGRDLGNGESILSRLGASPTYKTPNGTPGDGIVVELTMPPEELLTPTLSSRSVAGAVSRVVAVSDGVPSHLVDEASFRKYLAGLDINGNSYGVGSEIAAQAKQIRQRDLALKEAGANYSLVDILVTWMNDHCYESTGHWKNVADYEGVNGLLKLVDAYNNLGVPLPYPKQAVRSTVNAITSDEAALTVCFPYNTWIGTNYIFQNVQRYGVNGDALVAEMRAELRANITEEMKYTREKVLQFKKPDGSFSYLIGETAANSEGMPVALPHTDEGDVNATFICICGISSSIFTDLGYTYIPQYTEADLLRFICRLAEQGSIVKSEYPTIVREATFDNENVGNESTEITKKANFNTSRTGSILVVEDPRFDREGNVLLMNSPNDGANCVDLDIHRGSNTNATRYFFEGEFMFEFPREAYEYWASDEYDPNAHDPFQGYIAQLNVGGVNHNLYALGFDISRETGEIDIFEYSSSNGKGAQNDLGFNAKMGEWFKIKIEYFVGDHDSVRIRVYFNDKLYAVSDNYYSPFADKYFGKDETQETYVGTFVNVMSYCYGRIYFDNLITYKDMERYSVSRDPGGEIFLNVDASTGIEKNYDFENVESGELPKGVISSEGNTLMSVTDFGDGKALKLQGGAEGSVKFPVNIKELHSTALSFATDVTVSKANDGAVTYFYATDRATNDRVICYALKVETVAGKQYAVLYEAANGTPSARISEVMIPVDGSTHKLRLDYYNAEAAVLIYLDDILLASSEALCANAHKLTANYFHIANSAGGYSEIYFDNVKATKYKYDYSEMSKPPVDSDIHDFAGEISPDVVLSGSAEVKDGALSLVALDGGYSTVKLPVNIRDTIASTVILELDFKTAGTVSQGTTYRLDMINSDGDVAVSFLLVATPDGLALRESAKGAVFQNAILVIPYGELHTLTIEYYKTRCDIQFYLDGAYKGESSVTYDPSVENLDVSSLEITAQVGSGELQITRLVAEAYNKKYIAQAQVDIGDTDKTGDIDFEEAVTSDIPTRIVNKVTSPGGKLRVKSAIKNGIMSKALSFETNPGGGDIIYLQAADIPASYKTVVFEADFYFTYDNLLGGAPFQFYLCNDKDAMAYMVQVTCVNNRINLQAITGAGDAEVPGRLSGTTRATSTKEGQWMTLRLEYYIMDDGTARIITYVNDRLLEDTNLYYMKSSKLDNPARTEITRVRLQAYSSTDAELLVDNVKFTYSDTAYAVPTPPEPEVPTVEDILEDKGVAVLPVKGGANGIVTLIHDDGYYTTGKLLDPLLEEHGLVADVAMVANQVYDEATDAPKPARLEWQKLLDTGRWGMINHSMTHGFWGSEGNGVLNIDESLIIKEVVTSGEILRKLFPSQKILTFAYPGFQGLEEKYGDVVYEKMKEYVAKNYIAGRCYQKFTQDFYKWEWSFMPAESIGVGYLQTTLNTIDAAAEGKIATIFVHNLVTDEDYENRNLGQYGNSYTPMSHITSVVEKIAEHTESGAVWNAHYEDAVLYLREAEKANVTIKNNGTSLSVNLTHTLDSAIYNYPLTVRAVADKSWKAVKIVQGSETSYALVKTENGLAFLDMELVPNAGMAVVTPINPDDIPTGDKPGAGWDDKIEVDSDILDFDNDGGSGTIDNSAWSD